MATANIILLGEAGVGKTTLLKRFETGEFRESSQTTEAELHFKNIILENRAITLNIYDTAGSERFRSVTQSYYRKGEGVLLVYDVTNAQSFLKLSSWLTELTEANDKTEILIVGNKNEDPERNSVTKSMVRRFAREKNLEYMEVSAMTGKNVQEAFLYLATKVLVGKGILTETYPTSLASIQADGPSKNNPLVKMIRSKKNSSNDDDIIRLETSMKKKKEKKKCC